MDERLLAYIRGFNPDSVIAFAENVGPDTLARRPRPGAADLRLLPRRPARRAAGEGGVRPAERAAAHRHRAGGGAGAGLRLPPARLARGRPRSLANATREPHPARGADGARPAAAGRWSRGDFTYDTAFAATLDLFRVGGGADAIFAANDVGAFGAIDALRFELGLRVPQDVKVVGFDDIAQAHWRSYDLTTVRVDLRVRVQALVRLILRRLKEPDAPPMQETVPTSLVVRGTVG